VLARDLVVVEDEVARRRSADHEPLADDLHDLAAPASRFEPQPHVTLLPRGLRLIAG
jgi:hypothetical protein